MTRTFVFLRAINVGGHTVTRERLRGLFEAAGLSQVETFLASGNVIVERGRLGEAALRKCIETQLREALGYPVETFLRTERDLADLVKGCPFAADEVAAARALNIAFLQAPLAADAEARLQGLTTDTDAFRTRGREVWWLCQAKQSESTFSNAVFERTVKVKATFRSFNTLERLAGRYLKA